MDSDLKFIVFIVAFFSFVIYFSGAAGVGILVNADELPNTFVFDGNPLTSLAIIGQIFMLGVAPEFSVLMTICIVPWFCGLLYIIIKALPFT